MSFISHHTYHRGALGAGVKGGVFKIPDQVFESPRAYLDLVFTIRGTENTRETRRAKVRPELWVNGTTHIALRLL